jgi:hypothetical protein
MEISNLFGNGTGLILRVRTPPFTAEQPMTAGLYWSMLKKMSLLIWSNGAPSGKRLPEMALTMRLFSVGQL